MEGLISGGNSYALQKRDDRRPATKRGDDFNFLVADVD